MTRLGVVRFVVAVVLIIATIPIGSWMTHRLLARTRAGPLWLVQSIQIIVLSAKVFLAQIAFYILLRILYLTFNLNDPRP